MINLWVAFQQQWGFQNHGNMYLTSLPLVSIDQSPWTGNSAKVQIKLHLKCKLHFLYSAKLMCLMCLKVSPEAKYWASWPSYDVYQTWTWAMKSALNSSFCAVTIYSKSRWLHGKKACFRGVESSLRKLPLIRISLRSIVEMSYINNSLLYEGIPTRFFFSKYKAALASWISCNRLRFWAILSCCDAAFWGSGTKRNVSK